jgi:branched-chain amino acid transport system substrate-binding protein
VIGISLSLTGDFGDTGQAAERGYELWAAQVNKSGGILGRQVELKIVDDTTSATQVVTNYESLITQDHVDLVFGPVSSLLTVPAARVAARRVRVHQPAGAPTVFALHLHSLFWPSPRSGPRRDFADYILPFRRRRPKTTATPAWTAVAAPVVEVVRQRLRDQASDRPRPAYPAEQADLGPSWPGWSRWHLTSWSSGTGRGPTGTVGLRPAEVQP